MTPPAESWFLPRSLLHSNHLCKFFLGIFAVVSITKDCKAFFYVKLLWNNMSICAGKKCLKKEELSKDVSSERWRFIVRPWNEGEEQFLIPIAFTIYNAAIIHLHLTNRHTTPYLHMHIIMSSLSICNHYFVIWWLMEKRKLAFGPYKADSLLITSCPQQ